MPAAATKRDPPTSPSAPLPASAPDRPLALVRTPAQALADLGSRPEGLRPDEVEARLRAHGPNRLAEPPRPSPIWLLLGQFRSGLFAVLGGAALFAGLLGRWKDAALIAGVTVFNGLLGFFQEHRAERALDALKKMLARTARVRRGGQVSEIAAEGLVPGDVVLLEAGDRVPADGRLLACHSLEIDESSFTGESVPARKDAAALADPATAVADRANCAFLNTTVTRGRGELLVTGTGAATEAGRLAGLLQAATPGPTPLQAQLDALGKRLAVVALVAVAFVAALEALRGVPFAEIVVTAIALAVAAIPEGMVAVVTVTLALGMQRMARQNAVVRRMASVETLGCTTDVCTDKTGTLTLNQMTARAAWFQGRRLLVDGAGYEVAGALRAEDAGALPDLRPLLEPLALCNDAGVRDGVLVGDPTEGALVVIAAKGGVPVEALRRDRPRLAEVPFEAASRLMATFHAASGEGRAVVHVKGALDALLDRCTHHLGPGGPRPLDGLARQAFQREADAMASRALRVLAVATAELPRAALADGPPAARLQGLTLVGLVGLVDPPRAEARDAIAACHRAGIAVRMITGDHPATAAAIAFELGIEGEALSGRDLDGLSDAELRERAPRTGVFARVSPEHKLRIVRALREAGRVVAMTGDGVNDAPALREAHIGVAMGRAGTEVAKEAATLVLADDHFATIVAAVREGRTLYANLVHFIRFQLATNTGAILTVLLAPVLLLPVPFAAAQLLWVNLIVDGPPAMALGLDAARPGLMEEAPRDPAAQILSGARLRALAFTGAVMAAGTLGVLWWSGLHGTDEHARTMAFTTFVLFQLPGALVARVDGRSLFSRHLLTNAKLWAAMGAVIVFQVLAIEVPALRRLLGTTDIGRADWLLAAAVASSLIWLDEGRKLLGRLLRRGHGAGVA